MMYISYVKETGTIRESETFKKVFYGALTEARGYVDEYPNETVIIRLTRADEIREKCVGCFIYADRVNEEEVALVAVSRTGYTVCLSSGGIYDVDKEGK